MADAHAAAARKFRARDARLSRPLRIQRARPRDRFHAAKRTAGRFARANHFNRALILFMDIPYEVTARPDTGLYNAKLGIWLFLASEVMLFGGLFSAYIFLRLGAEDGYWPHGLLNVPVGAMNTAILIASSVTVVLAWASLKMRKFAQYKLW